MKKIKAIISTYLALVIIVLSVVSTFAVSSANVTEQENFENKIAPGLQSALETLDANDKVKVAVWLNDIESEEKEEAFSNKLFREKERGKISAQLYSKCIIPQNDTELQSQQMSLDEVQMISSIKRSSHKELHIDRNAKWKGEIEKAIDDLNVVYSSQYAPVVFVETSKSNLNKISLFDEVECVYLWNEELEVTDDDIQIEPSSTDTETTDFGVWQNITNIYTMRYVLGYDGEGVKIGLLENGLPDLDHSSGVFEDSNITAVNEGEDNGHASKTAAIIVGKTDDYAGVVPNAELYCAAYDNGYIQPIELLIDNGIDILSISLGLGYNTNDFNTYGNYSKYLDYVVYNYGITVCKSAGNYSNNPGVPEGAMGYNLITVGNLDDNNSSDYDDYIIHSTSSYVTSELEAYKPDICAPGARAGTPYSPDVVENGYGGTSLATPIVAGICAMLIQAEPALISSPMLIKSILMSSAERLPNMDCITSTATTTSPSLSREYGAGLVDAKKAYDIARDEDWYYIPLITSEQSRNPYTVNVAVSQNAIDRSKKMAVCLTWTQKVISSSFWNSTVYDVYHHDLGVYDPNGNLVAYSNYQYDRKQFIYFQPSVAGTYQIKAYKTGTAQSSVLTAISYDLS